MLEWKKSNYGPVGERIALRWKNGVYVPEPTMGSIERAVMERKVEDVFLTLLKRFNQQGRKVGDRKGPSYAPALFAAEREAKQAKVTKDDLADAMRRLFDTNKIKFEPYGRPSNPHFRLVIA
ncbi:MAG: hypothetical protein P8Y53_16000 [Pseudolabrys sp.]